MTDKELLELAAHACGYELAGYDGKVSDWLRYIPEIGAIKYWNPLEDDGDALRLAVKLGFGIDQTSTRVWAFLSGKAGTVSCEEEKNNNDLSSSTRRAIVRAAAEIAKAKGE